MAPGAAHSSHKPPDVLHLELPPISVQSVNVSPRYVAGKTQSFPETVTLPPDEAQVSHKPIDVLHFDTPPMSVQSVSVSPRYVAGKTHCLPDVVTRPPDDDDGDDDDDDDLEEDDEAHSSHIPLLVLHLGTPPISVQLIKVSPR